MLAMPDLVPVRFRDCSCPGTPHPDGDVAELRPYLDYPGGAEALASVRRAINESIVAYPGGPDAQGIVDDAIEAGEPSPPDALALATAWEEYRSSLQAQYSGPVFIRRGVVAWNLLDEDGDPVPVTNDALDALRWEDAYELADRADDLYGGQVLAPLVKRMSTPSKAGRTNGSTRRPRKSSPKAPTPSAPSS